MGYKSFLQLKRKESIKKTIRLFLRSNGPVLMEVCIDTGSIKSLQRPKNLKKIKNLFLNHD